VILRQRALVVATALFCPVLGCRSGAAPQRAAVVATTVDLEQVNELLPGHSPTTVALVRRCLFAPLLEEQPDHAEHPPTFAPALAERFEWSADRTALTFHLRAGLTWSDGAPLTAEDVRWTWQAQTSPDVAWDYSFVKEQIQDVEVVDARTARFHFTAPSLGQLGDAVEGVILPRHAWSGLPFAEWRKRPEWFRENLVVSGPFLLESWTPQQEIVLRRNPRFHVPGRPRLDRLVFRILPDRAGQLTQLLSGAVDFVEAVGPGDWSAVERSERARLIGYPTRQYNAVVWNLRKDAFADAATRRALTLAIDRPRLVDTLYRGRARVGVSPLVTGIWAHDPSLEPLPHDPAAARRELAAAGWRDGDGDGVVERAGAPFRFDLVTNTGAAVRADALVLIQDDLRRVGVEARPRVVEPNALMPEVARGSFDAWLAGWEIDTALDLWANFHSQAIAAASNFGGYSDPAMDRLLDEFERVADEAAARALLSRIERVLHQEQPYTFLWEPQRFDGASRRLGGARPNALSPFFEIEEWHLAGGDG
jgi:peptide/nickel transport system substrate-binding protein